MEPRGCTVSLPMSKCFGVRNNLIVSTLAMLKVDVTCSVRLRVVMVLVLVRLGVGVIILEYTLLIRMA